MFLFVFDAGDYARAVSSALTINDSSFICKENFVDTRTFNRMKTMPSTPANVETDSNELPTIYFVTPTYPRREQIAEITRLGQTLMHVPNLHWIVADDVDSCNSYLDTLLDRFGKHTSKSFHYSKLLMDSYKQILCLFIIAHCSY